MYISFVRIQCTGVFVVSCMSEGPDSLLSTAFSFLANFCETYPYIVYCDKICVIEFNNRKFFNRQTRSPQ